MLEAPAAPAELQSGASMEERVARRLQHGAELVSKHDVRGWPVARLLGAAASGIQPGETLDSAIRRAVATNRWLTEDELVGKGFRAMMAELNDGSEYVDRASLHRFSETKLQSTFGLSLAKAEPYPVVMQLEPDSPAAAAGVRQGDEIVAIDGVPTTGVELSDLRQRLAQADEVVLALRWGLEGPRTIVVGRGRLDLPDAIECRIIDRQILYVRASVLGVATLAQIREAARAAASIAGKMVLDLRGNDGGPLETAFELADLFLASGELGRIESQGQTERRMARLGDTLEGSRLVILIDRATQGAPELVAAAVQDHRRGAVLGERSRGLGASRAWWVLEEGDALWITISRVLRGTGEPLQDAGVVPDQAAPRAPVAASKRVEEAACPGTRDGAPVMADPLVAAAVARLRAG